VTLLRCYWEATDRILAFSDVQTAGEIELSYHSPNIIDEYPQELGRHPMSES
jgi:hypothetical protein